MVALKVEKFKRSKHIDYFNRGYFSSIEETITWANKVIVTIFFTPVVAITSLFTKSGLLILANSVVALCQIANVIFKCVYRLNTLYDLSLSFFGMSTFIFIAISSTPNFFLFNYTFANLFFSINVVATAINSFFLLHDVVIPPAKQLISSLFQVVGIETKGLYQDLELTKDRDAHILNTLINELFSKPTEVNNYEIDILLMGLDSLYEKGSESDKKILKDVKDKINKKREEKLSAQSTLTEDDKIKKINKILSILNKYHIKYHKEFLGHIVRQSDIKGIEKAFSDVLSGTNPMTAVRFIKKKIYFKLTKIKAMQEIQQAMKTACENEDINFYNKFLQLFFDDVTLVKDLKELNSSYTECSKEFEKAIKKQTKKVDELNEALEKKITLDNIHLSGDFLSQQELSESKRLDNNNLSGSVRNILDELNAKYNESQNLQQNPPLKRSNTFSFAK